MELRKVVVVRYEMAQQLVAVFPKVVRVEEKWTVLYLASPTSPTLEQSHIVYKWFRTTG